jgi:cellobiose-specific phosphotransferase system component IIC
MNSIKQPTQQPESPSSHAAPSQRSVAIVAAVVTLIVGYQLYKTAAQTGNYEGMWFSLAHTVLVAIATVVALRVRKS